MNIDIVKELKIKRRDSLCQKVNRRIEMPFESSFEIGMGIDAKGSIFASPIDYDESQIISKPNHSKGNSRIFQATNKEENLKQIQITSKIEVCGVCFETSGALEYMANQTWAKNSMNIYIAHCYEGNTKKILRHPKLRKSAKKFLQENGLQKFIDRYGSHYISGFVNAASFFGQLNIQANSEEEVKKLGTQLKGQLGKIVSKSLENEEKQQLKKVVQNCNISSYMDVRGVPVNKSAMNPIDMMEAYQEFIQFFNNKEKEPDFPYKAICDSWLQIEEVAEMQGIHEDFLEIAELYKNKPQVQKIETCEDLIYQKEYQKAVEILLELDLVNLKQLIERLEYQGLVFDLIRLRSEFSKLKEDNQRIKFILEDYFWEYRVNEKKALPVDYTGKGFKRYKDGKYFGSFLSGKRHGYGVFQWKDKTRYIGNFIEDKRQGQGAFINKKSIRIEGDFQQSKVRNPVHIYPSGKKFVGSIVEGQLIQKGELQLDNGTSYDGYFLDEKLMGFGTMYKNKKLASQGFWLHGEFIGEKTCGDEINGIVRFEIKEGQLEIYYSFFEENIILFHGTLRNELPIQGQGTFYYLNDIEKGIFGQENVPQKKVVELNEKVISDFQYCYQVNCDDESSSDDESDSETPTQQNSL